MRRRRFLALSVASIAGLVGTGAAQAVIIPQSSIAGIKLGMTRAEVRAHSGEPSTIVRGSNDFGAYTTFRYFRLRVTFQGNEGATAVSTTRTRGNAGRNPRPLDGIRASSRVPRRPLPIRVRELPPLLDRTVPGGPARDRLPDQR